MYFLGIREAGGTTYTCDKGGVFRCLQKLINIILHTSSAILVHSRSFNFKIFFNHGECVDMQIKPFQDFHEGTISKFSSPMVTV